MKLGTHGGLVHLVGHGEVRKHGSVPTRDVLIHHGRVQEDYRRPGRYLVLLCVPGQETCRVGSVREAVERARETGRRVWLCIGEAPDKHGMYQQVYDPKPEQQWQRELGFDVENVWT